MALNITSGSRYFITNAKAETVADLSGEDNRSVIGYGRHGGDNQQWEVHFVGDGWHICNVSEGKFLALDGDANEGTAVIAHDEPFVWHLWPDTDIITAARIAVPSTNLVLDLSDNGNPEPGTPIAVWGRWEGHHQVWYFHQVE